MEQKVILTPNVRTISESETWNTSFNQSHVGDFFGVLHDNSHANELSCNNKSLL